ncbi:SAM-dependent methyltransferase [Erythrobacter sp. 3-20A1M]|uniref:SAM-dependent methyltransferase n=1 Tax=Erythrobacter sp. 3-20A1M TaxID=2653850 RepID=UPI001BFC3B84|nr:SAM-dependent methyltransferase [Erythrobacter sp. 3-20A1M]
MEPSAGEGAFSKLLPPGSLAVDIDPRHPDIIKANFLEVELASSDDIVVIGNPPFGRNSSLAVKFFNHAATFASTIGFILPRTFQKHSIHKRLDPHFHCVFEEVLHEDSFVFEGERASVPTVFQIWERRSDKRMVVTLPTTHPDFEITTPEHADFAIQRVGSRAGRVHRDFSASPNAHYFIEAIATDVEVIMRSLDLASLARRTAGNPSLARTELVAAYVERKNMLLLTRLWLLALMNSPVRSLVARGRSERA